MPDVTLYHVPPSFYSQIARLTLHELEVPFKAKVVAPGPPTFETYKPWYMKLNPMGTVPTLVHDKHVVPDSDAIMRYAVETLSSVKRIPDAAEAKDAMEHWNAALRAIPIRELSYGAEDQREMGQRVNRMRVRNLETRGKMRPDMAAIYAKKVEDIQGFAERAVDDDVVSGHREQVARRLDEMNALLDGQPWLAGDSYSLADTVWTVGVARFMMLKLDPLEGRPALGDWYERVKARPSFKAANVWEYFDATAMLLMLGRKFLPQLLLIASGIALLVWWLVR